MSEVVTLKYPRVVALGEKALFSEGQAMSLVRNKRRPTRTDRFLWANTGSPTRRETHGDGTPIVTGWCSEGAALERGSEHAL